MAEFNRPGVFVKDVPSVPPPPTAAPTALGIVGFTLKGPSNRAVQVQSFEDFQNIFGGFTPLSLVPLTLDKYFNNGGQTAWVVRITPVGSIKAENRYMGPFEYATGLGFGDGATVLFSGIIPGAPLARAVLFKTIPGDGTAGPYTFTVPGGIVPHTLGIQAAAQFAIDEAGAPPAGTFIGDVAASVINYSTGVASITFAAPVPLGTNVLVYTSVTQVRAVTGAGVQLFAFDDGLNNLIGRTNPIGPNDINYLTGAFDIHFTAAPDGTALIHLQNSKFGTAGNVAIISSNVGIVVTGMSGGNANKPATGTIASIAGAGIADGDTLTISDGVTVNIFEFDSNGIVVAGHIPIPFTALDSAITVANSTRAAINGALFGVLADEVWAYTEQDQWLFTAQAEGAFGNNLQVDISGSSNFRKQERFGEFVGSSFLAEGNGSAGPYEFIIPDVPLIPNTVTIHAGNQVATDDGDGDLVGDVVSGSVNYVTGAVIVTFAATIPVGAGIRVVIDGFQFYDVTVSEFDVPSGTFVVQEVFPALNITNPNDPDFLTTVVDDPVQGSALVQAITGTAGVPPFLIRSVTKFEIDTGGSGVSPCNGVNRRFQSTIPNVPIDPFSVKVYVQDNLGVFQDSEVLDDGVGFLTGPNVDSFGVNQIDYVGGVIDVTLKTAPPVGWKVFVISAVQQTDDIINLTGGSDGTGVTTRSQIAIPSLEAQKDGVFAFNAVEDALNIVVPDFAESALVLNDLINFAEAKKDRFIIGTTAHGLTPQEAVNFRRSQIRSNSSFVGVYYPWVRTVDRSNNRTRTVPPLGHVGGVYSRTDRTRSEGKAPAGTVDGLLLDIVGLERILENDDVATIFPVNLNAIVQSAAIGIYVDGTRTLSSDINFKYIPVRRVFIAIRVQAEVQLKFALFEPIGPALFSKISAVLTSIALGFFQKGALAGTTPADAFLVQVDELNDQALADQGIVKCRLSIAPTKPAEFISVELAILQRQNTIVVTSA